MSASTSQSQSHRDRFVAIGGIGSCGIGLLALIAGLLLRHHYEPIRQACNLSVGLFSQEVSGHALAHCGLDGTLADIGTALIVCGIVILAITLLFGVALLLGVGGVPTRVASKHPPSWLVSSPPGEQCGGGCPGSACLSWQSSAWWPLAV